MLNWQHYKKRFGNILLCHKHGIMTDRVIEKADVGLGGNGFVRGLVFGNSKECRDPLLNKCCFPWFSQYIWFVCMYIVCISSHYFIRLKTSLCNLMIREWKQEGRHWRVVLRLHILFSFIGKGFLCPRSWVKELLLFSTKYIKFCQTSAKHKSVSLRLCQQKP